MDAQTKTERTRPASLRGARVAFTGKLATLPRRRAIELVRAAGGEFASEVSRRTSLLVVGMDGWPLLPDGSVSKRLQRAEALRTQGRPIEILSEPAFLERLGRRSPEPAARKAYTAEVIRNLLKVRPETLRRWEQLGLVRSVEGRFDYQDLVSLRAIAELVQQGVRPETIGRSLRGLSSVMADLSRPLAQLRLVAADPHTLLAEFGGVRISPDGQMLLGFDREAADTDPTLGGDVAQPPSAGTPSASPVARPPSAGTFSGNPIAPTSSRSYPASAHDRHRPVPDGANDDTILNRHKPRRSEDRWDAEARILTLPRDDDDDAPGVDELLEQGLLLEAEQCWSDAAEAYYAAIALAGRLPEAHFNLGNVLCSLRRFEAAAEHYRLAAAQDPAMAPAWYNLADLLDEEGRLEDAVHALRTALDADPDFADAHYNLARLYEVTARPAQAAAHWRRYIELDPASDWTHTARTRLAACSAAPRLY